MINMNLLPEEIKTKIKKAKQSANVFSICLIVIVAFIALSIVTYSLKNNYLMPKLDDINVEIKAANDELTTYDKLEQQALLINDRFEAAKKIEENRVVWSVIIQELANSVPNEVQFTDLSIETEKTPNFVLQGNTASERDAIKFKEKLENSDYFKDVAFKSSSVNTDQKDQAKNLTFSLEFNLEKKAPEAKTAKEKK